MAFILDKAQGKGKSVVKVTPAGVNNTEGKITGKILVQVNGITKRVVQLIQNAKKSEEPKEYQVFIEVDKSLVGPDDENIKVTYWVTMNGKITDYIPNVTGLVDQQAAGDEIDGKHWVIDKIPANYGDVTYTASFTMDGKTVTDIVKVIQKKAEPVTDDIFVYIEVDKPSIGSSGDVVKITSWVTLNGEISKKYNPDITGLVDKQTYGKDEYGRTYVYDKIPANYGDVTYIATLEYGGKVYMNSITLKMKAEEPVVPPEPGEGNIILHEFDFFCFRYGWEEEGGKDLDSATFVTGSKIPISGDKVLDDYFVGYEGNGNNDSEVSKFLKWGGDNTDSGAEGAFINWKDICNRDLISQGITKLYAYIYGNWYGEKGTGDMTLHFMTYKGTGMIKNGYIFEPDENTVLVTDSEIVINCNAYSEANVPELKKQNVVDFYSLIAVVEYDVATSTAVLKPNLNKSGRCVTSSVNFDPNRESGEVLHFGSNGNVYKHLEVPATGTDEWYDHTFGYCGETLDIDPETGSINKYRIYADDDPELEDDYDWIRLKFNRDSDGHITKFSYFVDPNYTGSTRRAWISFSFGPTVRPDGNILSISIYQKSY